MSTVKHSILDQYPDYEVVIGMEVHAQLTTNSKIFSTSANNQAADTPNVYIDPLCLGYPGTLPMLNKHVVDFALIAGCATNCTITKHGYFDRKHYFYPDLPKGYQITQGNTPICRNGSIPIRLSDGTIKNIRIHSIHMEEDAGKSIHDKGSNNSLIDLNRAGAPLLEIVSEPDISSADETRAYLKMLRLILMYCGVCTGDMEKGAFRADTNISVKKKSATKFGTRCELKNINSFKFIGDAIEYEIERQITLLESGEVVKQETRLWDTKHRKTVSMREKEAAADYRYFRDPDLPDLVVDDAWINKIKDSLPELPYEKYTRLQETYSVTADEADILVNDPVLCDYFEKAMRSTNSKLLIRWLMRDLLGYLNQEKLSPSESAISPEQLAQLVNLIENKTINNRVAQTVFEHMIATGKDPETIVKEEHLEQMGDTAELEQIIKDVIAHNPQQVASYKAGKEKMWGFFVGQVMKKTQGKADPQQVNELLKKHLL